MAFPTLGGYCGIGNPHNSADRRRPPRKEGRNNLRPPAGLARVEWRVGATPRKFGQTTLTNGRDEKAGQNPRASLAGRQSGGCRIERRPAAAPAASKARRVHPSIRLKPLWFARLVAPARTSRPCRAVRMPSELESLMSWTWSVIKCKKQLCFQRLAKLPLPGCENVASKFRQK